MQEARAVLALAGGRVSIDHTLVMGVVNVTPDSFSDGGRFAGEAAAIAQGRALAAAGADVVDVGGESTRPGAAPVTIDEELRRVLPVVRALAAESRVSIDTRHAAVAEAALAAGAVIVNDVTGGRHEPALLAAAARARAVVILGHLRGDPSTMQKDIAFRDVVVEVGAELAARVTAAVAAGVARERLWVDPGIGFGKTFDHNLTLLQNVAALERAAGAPVLVGPSRKAFLGAITGKPAGPERDAATLAAVTAAILSGARGVRVHDVAPAVDAARVADALVRGRVSP